jgi:hypothetical protein
MIFQSDNRDAAKTLWAEAPSVYRTAPQKMHKSVEKIAANSGTDLAKQFSKASARLAKTIKVQSKVQ